MIIGSPPLEMGEQVWGLLCCGPGSTCQSCDAMTHRQIHPLNESGVESSRETQFLQGNRERSACSKTHHRSDPNQLAPLVGFFHLTIQQPRRYLPLRDFPPAATQLKPLSKMGRERIEVQI